MKLHPFYIVMIVGTYVLICLTHANVKEMASDIRDIKLAICAERKAK